MEFPTENHSSKKSAKSSIRKELLQNQLYLINKMRNDEVSNLNALASSTSQDYFSGNILPNSEVIDSQDKEMLPQLGLTFEFSILDEENTFSPEKLKNGASKNGLEKQGILMNQVEAVSETVADSDTQATNFEPIEIKMNSLDPPQKGVFSNRLIFDDVDPVVNCSFEPLNGNFCESETDTGPDIPEDLQEMIKMVQKLLPDFALGFNITPSLSTKNPEPESDKDLAPMDHLQVAHGNGDLKSMYSSQKMSNYTSNNFSRQESNINDYLIDDDGEEFFDPNEDDVSSLESIGEQDSVSAASCRSDKDSPEINIEKSGSKQKSPQSLKSLKSSNTEELIEESEQFDVDDQTYFEDFSAIDSIAVDNDKVSKMKSYVAEGYAENTTQKNEGSFDISIGNKKIELPKIDTMERKYFDEYIEAKEDDEADKSSMMYNSFISGE